MQEQRIPAGRTDGPQATNSPHLPASSRARCVPDGTVSERSPRSLAANRMAWPSEPMQVTPITEET